MKKNTLISVGRQFGSGGKAVAAEVGRELGIEVFDNELITKAAEHSGFSRELFLRRDETRSFFPVSAFFASSRYGSSDGYTGENVLFRIQSQVIRDIAHRQAAIFIGRCSDYILRDMDCLDVFICAPMENRKIRISERDGISPEEAEARIRKTDRTRATYYNYFTLSKWGEASNYDLCVDSSVLGIEKTASFIVNFAREMGLCQ